MGPAPGFTLRWKKSGPDGRCLKEGKKLIDGSGKVIACPLTLTLSPSGEREPIGFLLTLPNRKRVSMSPLSPLWERDGMRGR
jgi:hypothetical protein